MNRTMTLTALAGIVGASMLLAAPGAALADRGDGWGARSGARDGRGHRVERRVERRATPRAWNRQWRHYGGGRVYRDMITIRSGRSGPGYRAWRTYSYPAYHYRRHVVVVRPVRFFVSAGAAIGGVHVRARIHDPNDWPYGCNFCDGRFHDFGAYRAHLSDCPHRPRGFRIEVHDWNGGGFGGPSWWDDRNWNDDPGFDG
ncbi:MAG: hypothetical protein ACM3JJ_12250 [Hyphomicrobiales bacterium]